MLRGLEAQHAEVMSKMATIDAHLRGRRVAPAKTTGRRNLSAEARKRIGDAQRLRWAKARRARQAA